MLSNATTAPGAKEDTDFWFEIRSNGSVRSRMDAGSLSHRFADMTALQSSAIFQNRSRQRGVPQLRQPRGASPIRFGPAPPAPPPQTQPPPPASTRLCAQGWPRVCSRFWQRAGLDFRRVLYEPWPRPRLQPGRPGGHDDDDADRGPPPWGQAARARWVFEAEAARAGGVRAKGALPSPFCRCPVSPSSPRRDHQPR